LLRRAPWAQWIALATTVLTLRLSLVIVVVFDGADPDFQLLDTILFFFCWEFTLVPLYFLVSLWGISSGRQAAAVRYFLVMLVGGVPLLPVHNRLPSLAMGAPAAVTALLVGLKLGAYGLIRFAIPLAPIAARDLHWLLAGLGTVAILYGAAAALAQSNLRGMLAYASLSHIGLVLLGLASFSVSALQGALLLLLNFSVATGGGFLVLAFLQRRTGSTDIAQLGGVMRSMPLLSASSCSSVWPASACRGPAVFRPNC
jgi:NADH-quinone oxidoreductase subunit M